MDERTRLTITFCRRWLAKADGYQDDSLDGAFDKFFTLFVAFNRLYSHAAYRRGTYNAGDKEEATVIFPREIGQDRIWTMFKSEPESQRDLRKLRQLIRPGGPFFLYSLRGELRRDEARNLDLYQRLGGVQATEAVKAMLQYLYQVRCNIFHGRKVFEERQLQILQPSIRCLERVVKLGMEVLTEEDLEVEG